MRVQLCEVMDNEKVRSFPEFSLTFKCGATFVTNHCVSTDLGSRDPR